jgi:hypothetical protein
MTVKLEDTWYSTAAEKAEFITQEIEDTLEQSIEIIRYSEELLLESLVHFCNTGNFLGE